MLLLSDIFQIMYDIIPTRVTEAGTIKRPLTAGRYIDTKDNISSMTSFPILIFY